jgi:hypothetical protein
MQAHSGAHFPSILTPLFTSQAFNKHDVMSYTLYNAPFIGIAGLAAGLQEAFYQFEVGLFNGTVLAKLEHRNARTWKVASSTSTHLLCHMGKLQVLNARLGV